MAEPGSFRFLRPALAVGTLRAFTAGTYLARVTLAGSLQMSLDNVPTSRAIPSAEMVAGRKVLLVLLDETKATDAVVLAVWT
jgi:hypothetical protein